MYIDIYITCYRNKASIHIHISIYHWMLFSVYDWVYIAWVFSRDTMRRQEISMSLHCKKNIQVRDCWAHHVSCISILHVFTFSGSKEMATFSEKISVIPSSHASFVHSKAKTKATHVWQADVSNNLAPLTDYIWRGEGRAFCNKMPDRIQVKNNEQLGNVETMFFQRQVCVSFCSMYKYVYLRTQQALHSATNVSSRNIACLTNCFIFWRGMAIPRNRCCLKWTKTCSGTLAWTTHPKKTRNQRTQMQITWQKKAESRKV